MADDNAPAQQALAPSPRLRSLDRLVGTWSVTGGARGTVTYSWMDGGFFLLQHVDFDHEGRQITGLEVIGHDRAFGAQPSADVRSRFYSNTGDTLDYVYELDGDTLTIWGGERGSPAYFTGRFDAEDTTVTGAWVYPGGGGYESTMTRISR